MTGFPGGSSATHRAIAIVALLVLSACSDGINTNEWVFEETDRDGARVIRTLSGSVWGGSAELEQELSISPRGLDEAYLFGEIIAVTRTDDRIYVLDRQVPTVRVYDSEGEHLMDIGRYGQGPGEFVYPTSVGIHPVSGEVLVRNGQNGRINLYDPETGQALTSWRIRAGWTTDSPLVVTPDGRPWTLQLLNRGSDILDWELGMVEVRPDGATGDTLRPPAFPNKATYVVARREGSSSRRRVPFTPEALWAMSTSGAMIGGFPADYSFEVHALDGSRTIIEKEWDPVPVDRREAEWYVLGITLRLRRQYPGWVWDGPSVPGHKPAYESLVPDRSGRIWVQRVGSGIPLDGCVVSPRTADELRRNPCWEQSSTFEVFDLQGRFLGPAIIPDGLRIDARAHIEGDRILAVFEDEEGTPHVRVYRLVLPERAGVE